MDAFKAAEISRMDKGGNKRWQDFFSKNNPSGVAFEECTIKERYDSEVGEEWKERLAAEVEGREFDEGVFKKQMEELRRKKEEKSRSATPVGGGGAARSGSRSGGGGGGRTESPAGGVRQGKGVSAEQKAQNEAYFARMGNANASRPEGLPPSQGGKYAGFGSQVPGGEEQQQQAGSGGMPGADDFQKDPVAALTKGFGWFGGIVSKQAKMVNDSYLQPTAKNVSCQYRCGVEAGC